MHIKHGVTRRIRAMSAVLAAVLALVFGAQVSQAAAATGSTAAAGGSTGTAGVVPTAELAKHLTKSWTVAIAPGATVRVGGVSVTARRDAARPGYVAGTTCTISVFGPYVDEPYYPAHVVVAASVKCTYPVSGISVSAYVFSYDPTTGSYYLLNDADYVSNYPNPTIGTVQTSAPISADGWYFGATNGYVGDPIDQSFSAVQNQATYVYPV